MRAWATGDWMVVEADESDGTFLKLPADIAVVTNIDPEHLDHYGTFDAVREAFRQFVENVPFYGFGVMCTDHPEVQALVGAHRGPPRHHLWRQPAGRRALHATIAWTARMSRFDVVDPRPQDRRRDDDRRPEPADARPAQRLERHGGDRGRARARHLAPTISSKGLAAFGGVKRRFTQTGTWNGVEIFDDYGHHPVEIEAVLKAARDAAGPRHRDRPAAPLHAAARPVRRVLRLLQRRRHGDRGAGLCGRRGADRGRQPEALVAAHPRRRPPRRALHRGPAGDRAAGRDLAKPGDFVVFLGAGNITQWAYALPKELGGGRRHEPRAKRFSNGSATGLPALRGRITPNAEMDKITWFRAGGLAEALFQPADEDDLAAFLKAVPEDVPLTVVGIGSNLLVRDGGIPGFVIRLSAKGFGEAEVISPTRIRAGAATPDKRVAALALRPASAASISITAFPAASAARCG